MPLSSALNGSFDRELVQRAENFISIIAQLRSTSLIVTRTWRSGLLAFAELCGLFFSLDHGKVLPVPGQRYISPKYIVVLVRSDNPRLRHCAVPPSAYATLGLYVAVPRLPLLLPAAAAYIRGSELLPRAAVPAHRLVGQKGVAMVYSRRAESVVDRPTG